MIRPHLPALFSCAVLALGGARLAAQAAGQAEPIPAQNSAEELDAQQRAADAKPDTNTKVFTSTQVGHDLPLPAGAPQADYHGDPPRIQSGEIAGALVNSLPKYTPPPPAAPGAKPAAAAEPQPRNGIIRLPKVVVRQEKPPVFNEKQLYTPKSLEDIEIQRYTGLDPAKMPGVAAPITRFMFSDYAKQMQADADRQQNISDSSDMARAAALSGDPGESEYIKRVSNETFIRDSDNTPSLGDPHGGGLQSPPPR
ncbi:MAG TPA: hypothetical protein VHC86_01545 [Opitutaceae bacterium]|nr:hypothetical protein [Opitutaceae bacterium]